MSDVIDFRLLGKMVAPLQSTVEDIREGYKGIRSSLDSLGTSVYSRFAEFNVRLSGLELGQMKLPASVDEAHTNIYRMEADLERLKEDLDRLREDQSAICGDLTGLRTEVAELHEDVTRLFRRQSETDSKLDLILTRLNDR